MANEMDDLVKEYLIESNEHLETIEHDLITIEENGANIDEELVNKVFRAAHSIKGGAGFFNLTAIQSVGHKTENALDLIRSHKLLPTSEVVNILLRAFDQLKEFVADYQNSEKVDTTQLLSDLDCVITGKSIVDSSACPKPIDPNAKSSIEDSQGCTCETDLNKIDFDTLTKDGRFIYLVKFDFISDVVKKKKNAASFMKHLLSCGEILNCTLALEEVDKLNLKTIKSKPFEILFATILDPTVVSGLLEVEDDKILNMEQIKELINLSKTNKKTKNAPTGQIIAEIAKSETNSKKQSEKLSAKQTEVKKHEVDDDATLRVRVSLLESLMNLASELVLSRNQLNGAIETGDSRLIYSSGQRINLVTSDLQETIMLARMQPIGNVFSKFPRVVRDLAGSLGKQINLELIGKDVEMDKTIIEGLSDPLTHMIRNSVDHGIETPEIRIAAGKPAEGTVRLSAFHEAGQVVIEITDDGGGLNVGRIVQKAITSGQITQAQADDMSEKEKMMLIFSPGLSTAEKVTNVSGRGVGMDVVKNNLDKLGGKVEIDSEEGIGTSFKVKLPLTLAIIPSLLVSLANESFAIPQVNVSELILIPKGQVANKIELVGNAEVLRLRGKLIPILHLSEVLGIDKEMESNIDLAELSPQEQLAKLVEQRSGRRTAKFRTFDRDLNIVIVNTGSFYYGLIVDGLHDTIEIVVKPVGKHLQFAKEYAGATILGNGNVALILDVSGLATKACLTNKEVEKISGRENQEESDSSIQEMSSFLLFKNSTTESCGIPLELVARVDAVEDEDIEIISGRRVMKYRGGLLPLITLKDIADVKDVCEEQEKIAVVFNIADKEVGLLATMPLNVAELIVNLDQKTLKQKGIMGSMVIENEPTMLLDIFELVEAKFPQWVAKSTPVSRFVGDKIPVILIAEDTDFFKYQIRSYVEERGYKAIVTSDGAEAWDMLNKRDLNVDILLTDIEMPKMNGFVLTEKIRRDGRFKGLPIIAVTSLSNEKDIKRGMEVGVTDYQVKLNKEKLLSAIDKCLNK